MSTATSSKTSVAEFLAAYVDRSGRSHGEIAKDSGMLHPRIIEMMCDGRAKVPINRVLALAATLGINAAEFARIVLAEYSPDTLAVVIALFEEPILLRNQLAFERVIEQLRLN